MSTYKKLTTVCAAVVLAFGLAACGGGDDTVMDTEPDPPPPTPYEMAMTNIAAAENAADAQAAYDAVKGDVTAAQGDDLQAAVDARIAMFEAAMRAMEQRAALMMAAGAIDTSDLSTADAVVAANAAIAALKAAIAAAADVDDTSMYQTMVDNAEMAVATAEGQMELDGRIMVQTAAITGAAMTLEAALGAFSGTPTAAEIEAAETALAALSAAIEAAVDVADADKAPHNTAVANASGQIVVAKAARMAADEAEAERQRIAEAEAEAERLKAEAEAAAERTAMGKLLKRALGTTPLAQLATDADTSHTLTATSLTLGIPDPDNVGQAIAGQRMAAGASAGSLGGWAGTHYAHTNAGTRVSNSAIVYNNRAAPTVKPFASSATVGTADLTEGTNYVAATRTVTLGDLDATTDVKGDDFPTAGSTTYTADTVTNAVVIRGTYQGAPGNYRCIGNACAATAGTGGAVDLSAGWFFVHDSGAMTSKADANYLYFGWWLQKDKDDEPTSASAFTGVVGDVDGDQAFASPLDLTGSATYVGAAAGKFAISDPLTGGDAGHFTADATLTAKFGPAETAGNGITGTLDNFMANEEAAPWSVSLLHADLNAAGGTVPVNDPNTAGVDESMDMTVWSIDGSSAAADGTWNAQLYDEKPGNAPTGDGSNVATSVTGTFQSHFGSTHTMVGAFGATKE